MRARRGAPAGLALGAAAVALGAAAVAGCTPRSHPTAPGSSAPTSAGSTAASTTPAAPTAPVPAATPTGAPPRSPANLPTCRTAQLQLTVQRGASASQQAFATLTLTNTGPACATAGFPGVSLLLGGAQAGPAARRAAVGYRTVTLARHDSAHALLSVSTSCNADRSQQVRVYPPDQTVPLLAPLGVYACESVIDPMQPGAS